MKALQFDVMLMDDLGQEKKNVIRYPNAQMKEAAVAIEAMLSATGYSGISVKEAEPPEPDGKELTVRLMY